METNSHIFIDYLGPPPQSSNTQKDPNPSSLWRIIIILLFPFGNFFACPSKNPGGQRTENGNNNNNALGGGGLGDFMAWKKKQGHGQSAGIEGPRFPFSPDGFYF